MSTESTNVNPTILSLLLQDAEEIFLENESAKRGQKERESQLFSGKEKIKASPQLQYNLNDLTGLHLIADDAVHKRNSHNFHGDVKRSKPIASLMELGTQDSVCAYVCKTCNALLGLRWSSLCSAQCDWGRGREFHACITMIYFHVKDVYSYY